MRAHRPFADRTFDWHEGVAGPRERLRASAWAAAQAALAAALAWFVAHQLLGHPQPFFAPIAAAVAMSTSYFGRRGRRAVQMVIGVLLGIVIAEAMLALLGSGTVALGVTVLVTMLVALVVGAGFVGEGPMFVNQAAGSAILVVAYSGTAPAPSARSTRWSAAGWRCWSGWCCSRRRRCHGCGRPSAGCSSRWRSRSNARWYKSRRASRCPRSGRWPPATTSTAGWQTWPRPPPARPGQRADRAAPLAAAAGGRRRGSPDRAL